MFLKLKHVALLVAALASNAVADDCEWSIVSCIQQTTGGGGGLFGLFTQPSVTCIACLDEYTNDPAFGSCNSATGQTCNAITQCMDNSNFCPEECRSSVVQAAECKARERGQTCEIDCPGATRPMSAAATTPDGVDCDQQEIAAVNSCGIWCLGCIDEAVDSFTISTCEEANNEWGTALDNCNSCAGCQKQVIDYAECAFKERNGSTCAITYEAQTSNGAPVVQSAAVDDDDCEEIRMADLANCLGLFNSALCIECADDKIDEQLNSCNDAQEQYCDAMANCPCGGCEAQMYALADCEVGENCGINCAAGAGSLSTTSSSPPGARMTGFILPTIIVLLAFVARL